MPFETAPTVVHDQIRTECGEFPVCRELLAPVNPRRTRRRHFDDHAWLSGGDVELRHWRAYYDDIRIVEDVIGDLNPHVVHDHQAGSIPGRGDKPGADIRDNEVVPQRRPRHRVELARHVFMADLRAFLEAEVLLDRHRSKQRRLPHASTVRSAARGSQPNERRGGGGRALLTCQGGVVC